VLHELSSDEAASVPGPSAKTLARSLRILEVFAHNHGAFTQTAVAAQTGIPVATVHRLVHTLAAHGYLDRSDSDAAVPGWPDGD
jgi:DNA-binding MarR family transcriptional regulator